MNRFLLITLFAFMRMLSYGQVPPNLLIKNESSIQENMKKYNFSLYKKDYSEKGYPILIFNDTQENSVAPTAMFKLEINNLCTECYYFFQNTTELEKIVVALNSDSKYKKVEDAFRWENIAYNYDVAIERKPEEQGFVLKYIWLRDIRKSLNHN